MPSISQGLLLFVLHSPSERQRKWSAIMLFSTVAAWLLCVVHSSSACKTDDLKLAVSTLNLRLSEAATITFPWDARWNDLQVRGSSPRISPDYNVVVEVATESDVQTTVALASRLNIPFLAVTGGHGWTRTLNKLPFGIQINMRKLNTTTLSQNGKTAMVGGGTMQHEITRSLFALGKYAGEITPISADVHILIVLVASYWAFGMCVGCGPIVRRRSQSAPEPTWLLPRRSCFCARSSSQRKGCRSLSDNKCRLVLGPARSRT